MKKIKEKQDIIIAQLPIRCESERAFELAVGERLLIDAICKYADKLRREGVEVWKRKDNVIATERGYFFSMFEEDIALVESGQFKPEEK